MSWADEELHYYYDPEAPVNTNQEIYTDTDEDTQTDDEIIDEWEPTSQQTIEEAKKNFPLKDVILKTPAKHADSWDL